MNLVLTKFLKIVLPLPPPPNLFLDGSVGFGFLSLQDMRLYQRYLEYRATTFMGGGSTCLSGRTMAYRTQLFRFDGFKNYFLNEHFAGQLQLSGDDKCLTRLCIMSDYKMWHQICEVRLSCNVRVQAVLCCRTGGGGIQRGRGEKGRG